MMVDADTIFAPATAPGRSAIAVLRLSGPRSRAAVESLRDRPLPFPGRLVPGWLRDPQTAQRVDYGMAVWFAAPATATGEETAEVHIHGSPAVLQSLMRILGQFPGCRPAMAGEFTRRAMMNGKMDLTAVEGLADLLAADTDRQRAQAISHLGGGLRKQIEDLQRQLQDLQARLEAFLEFPDDDLDAGLFTHCETILSTVLSDLDALLASLAGGQQIRDGVTVVLLGRPNAGKSSLLNALARRDVAIVTPEAGTTRDVVEVTLDLDGVPVRLSDTAGLRQTSALVEQEGIRRALERAAQADLVILVDGPEGEVPAPPESVLPGQILRVWNKADLVPPPAGHPVDVVLSAKAGQGVTALESALRERVSTMVPPMAQVSLTRARHGDALDEAKMWLEAARSQTLPDLMAEDLRLAQRALGRVVGTTDPEMILDRLFSSFCIGK